MIPFSELLYFIIDELRQSGKQKISASYIEKKLKKQGFEDISYVRLKDELYNQTIRDLDDYDEFKSDSSVIDSLLELAQTFLTHSGLIKREHSFALKNDLVLSNNSTEINYDLYSSLDRAHVAVIEIYKNILDTAFQYSLELDIDVNKELIGCVS